MVVLLTHLKIFQHLGRFLPIREVPHTAATRIARALRSPCPRASTAIRGPSIAITPRSGDICASRRGGEAARELAVTAMAAAAQGRLDPADLINAAIDALIRARCELPHLSRLRLLAGSAHKLVNTSQWNEVSVRLSAKDRPPARLTARDRRRHPGVALRAPLPRRRESDAPEPQGLDRALPLGAIPDDPLPLLAPISPSKVAQWARTRTTRLKAGELRRYVAPRRYALLLAVLREGRGKLLDELTVMLLKFSGRIQWRSMASLDHWHTRQCAAEELVRCRGPRDRGRPVPGSRHPAAVARHAQRPRWPRRPPGRLRRLPRPLE